MNEIKLNEISPKTIQSEVNRNGGLYVSLSRRNFKRTRKLMELLEDSEDKKSVLLKLIYLFYISIFHSNVLSFTSYLVAEELFFLMSKKKVEI
ncbi:hypothetical protein SU60_07050 [Vibrio mytili]|uniref:Uncharacterized protein n=1 Tax=Vibrio mytili TaxID=50718 RepID=A0A0C3HTN8_9VIBR|nr:hypothetical protein SU60_07050 [Vibrio mytili]